MSRFFKFNLAVVCFFTVLTTAAHAETSKVMVVFDASGSMWGQIDGVAKIEIAQNAFADLSDGWQADGLDAGLIAYGHRRKGDCSDIELLSTPGDASTLGSMVQTLSPRGKTPLSDAVLLAAETLRYTEEAATVILLSDGRETCGANPCELGVELEKLGIDFTAHVIGFGLDDRETREELQCLAQATGGRYFDAKDADALTTALRDTTTVAEAPISPALIPVHIDTLPEIESRRPKSLTIIGMNLLTNETRVLGTLSGTQEVLTGLSTALEPGEWRLSIESDEGAGSFDATVTADTSSQQAFVIPFVAPQAGFILLDHGPYQVGLEHAFFLTADAEVQDNKDYWLALYPLNAKDGDNSLSSSARLGTYPEGMTLHTLTAPDEPGEYEIILSWDSFETAPIRKTVIFADGLEPTWNGPRQGAPGELLPVSVTGYLDRLNRITLHKDGAEVFGSYLSDMQNSDGFYLPLPQEAGTYQMTYHFAREQYGKRHTADLGELRVGDAETSHATQEEAAAKFPVMPGHWQGFDLIKWCHDEMCWMDIPAIDAEQIPLLRDAAIAFPDVTETGRPSFEIANLRTGDLFVVNPILQGMGRDCIGFGADGYRDPDNAPHTDYVCYDPQMTSVDSLMMLESLESWISDRNEQAYEAQAQADRIAHAATMSDDVPFYVQGKWRISNHATQETLGYVIYGDYLLNDPNVIFELLLTQSEKFGPFAGEITWGRANLRWDKDSTPRRLERIDMQLNDDAGELRITMKRPADWNGTDEVWEGLTNWLNGGKSVRVRFDQGEAP